MFDSTLMTTEQFLFKDTDQIPLLNDDFFRNTKTLRVIGDVHGEYDMLKNIIDSADDKTKFMFVGDLVDRGPKNPEVIGLVLFLIKQGRASYVPGNHCYKYARYVKAEDKTTMKVSHGLGETIDQMNAHPNGEALANSFKNMALSAPIFQNYKNLFFAHASYNRAMTFVPKFSLGEKQMLKRYGAVFQSAIFGMPTEEIDEEGYRVLSKEWIDEIDDGMVVYVGHTALKDVTEFTGKKGGKAVYVDTGAGKGGVLSYVDMDTTFLKSVNIIVPTYVTHDGKPLLTLMVGPAGAGKSTYVKQHYPAETVLNADTIRDSLGMDERNPDKKEMTEEEKSVYAGLQLETWGIVYTRALHRLNQGLPVVLDNTHIVLQDLIKSVHLIPEGNPIEFVIINRSLKEKYLHDDWRHHIKEEKQYKKRIVETNLLERHHEIYKSNILKILDYVEKPHHIVKFLETDPEILNMIKESKKKKR